MFLRPFVLFSYHQSSHPAHMEMRPCTTGILHDAGAGEWMAYY